MCGPRASSSFGHRHSCSCASSQQKATRVAGLLFSKRSERQDDCTRRFAGRLRYLQFDRDLIPTIRDMYQSVAAPHAESLSCEPSTICRGASALFWVWHIVLDVGGKTPQRCELRGFQNPFGEVRGGTGTIAELCAGSVLTGVSPM
jgi:hypothetical protein